MIQNPIFNCDSYKLGHMAQYPKGTEFVYANFTPRSAKHFSGHDKLTKIVLFGPQGFFAELDEAFNEGFFERDKEELLAEVSNRVIPFVGPSGFDISKIAALHDLGYLPIKVKALPEGSKVNIGVPVLTITNTLPEFYWITNFLETWMSCELWKMSTSATTAYEYRRILDKYAEETGSPTWFTDWQAHDFSMRGMSGVADAAKSGAAHLTSFTGTDCLPALGYLEKYYGGKETFIGGSVPATEHSVMCMGGFDDELGTFKRLITEIYPAGIVSIVSDTWDFWKVITVYSKELKEFIMNRSPDSLGSAKVVFRPDSGDPVEILCGTAIKVKELKYDSIGTAYHIPEGYAAIEVNGKYYQTTNDTINGRADWIEVPCIPEFKGAVECLWDIFGGTMTDKGYKVLDSHVGLIYGDSITIERSKQIMQRLKDKGFASCNTVLGVGSYTYQHVTRDTFGFAMKATYGVVNGEAREIYKDPKTDNGVKKSAKGLLRVEKEGDNFVLYDQQTPEQEHCGELKVIYENGFFGQFQTLEEIRARVKSN